MQLSLDAVHPNSASMYKKNTHTLSNFMTTSPNSTIGNLTGFYPNITVDVNAVYPNCRVFFLYSFKFLKFSSLAPKMPT